MKYVCVHGHFYQPPRETLEAVELQDSAYPYHDWNERVTAECYAPNAMARLLDDQQHIIELVGTWPVVQENWPAFVERLQEYVIKATREAAVRARWTRPRSMPWTDVCP